MRSRGGGVVAAATRLALHAVAATPRVLAAFDGVRWERLRVDGVDRWRGPRRKSRDRASDAITARRTQVRLARLKEEKKRPGPRQGPLCLRGERPQDRRFLSMEPGLAQGLFSEPAERPVGAGAVFWLHFR